MNFLPFAQISILRCKIKFIMTNKLILTSLPCLIIVTISKRQVDKRFGNSIKIYAQKTALTFAVAGSTLAI